LRGSGRFKSTGVGVAAYYFVFQSPSLRGSGRFQRSLPNLLAQSIRFNPLHCGAVVASLFPFIPLTQGFVSIPFIAGQWSLLLFHSRYRPKDDSFNPLHCGAVVASSASVVLLVLCVFCFNPLHCEAVVASVFR